MSIGDYIKPGDTVRFIWEDEQLVGTVVEVPWEEAREWIVRSLANRILVINADCDKLRLVALEETSDAG